MANTAFLLLSVNVDIRPSGNARRHERLRRGFLCAAILWPLSVHLDFGTIDGTVLGPIYAKHVLNIPESERSAYADLLAKNLTAEDSAQYVLIVDCNKFVQAAMSYWMSLKGGEVADVIVEIAGYLRLRLETEAANGVTDYAGPTNWGDQAAWFEPKIFGHSLSH